MQDSFALKGNILCSGFQIKEAIQEYPDSYLVCENGICQGVYRRLPEEYANIQIYDYGECMIIPGLVDLHIHAPQYAFRGMGMDLELMEWLQRQTFPEEAKYADDEYAHKAYSIFAEQMKKSATTRAVIFATSHRKATEMLMELMEETGVVSYVGKVNMDRGAPENLAEKNADVSAQETYEWLDHVGEKFKWTKPILTPRFIPSCTNSLLEALRKIRLAYDLPVQSHLSENPGEIELVHQLFPEGEFYGDCYDRYDLFGKRPGSGFQSETVMAHCVYSTDAEISLLKRNQVFMAHCPSSNMNLSSGIAPVRRYITEGLKIGLGSDVAGGESESIFRAMTEAIQVSKIYWRLVNESMKPLSFDEAFYLATRGGGGFFGKVGAFEKGYAFDALVLADCHLPHPQKLSLHQRLERFAYLSGDVQGLMHKYVGGRMLY